MSASSIRRLAGLAWLTAGWLAASSPAVHTQTRDAAGVPLKGTGSVSGTVVADDQGRTPIRHATMTLSRLGTSDERAVATDDQGRFTFSDLPAAVFTLSASKGAYLTAHYGAASATSPGAPIPLTEGQAFVGSPIVLVHGAAISGRITDAAGQPAQNTNIRVLRVEMSGSGERQSRLADSSVLTDARGFYRVYGLAAGDYVVQALNASRMYQSAFIMSPAVERWLDQRQVQPGAPPTQAVPMSRPFVASPTYFPSTPDLAKASIVTVGRGEDRTGVDIVLVRVATARITGTIVGPEGQPAPGAVIVRTPKQEPSAPQVAGLMTSRSASDGTFSISGVQPGDYVLSVRAASAPSSVPSVGLPTAPLTLWGQADVAVNGDDIEGLEIHLQPGMTVSGTIAFEGASPPPADLTRYRPTVVSRDRTAPTVTLNTTSVPGADPTFKLEGLTPGPYQVSGLGNEPVVGGAAPVWMIKAITVNGQDVLNEPLEIHPGESVTGVVATYTDRYTDLVGHLVNAAGQPASQYQVLLFPTDERRWTASVLKRWVVSVRAAVDGSFRVIGLPPGEYYLCALTEGDPNQHLDAAFLAGLVGASLKVTLAAGELHRQTFRVGG